MTESDSTGPATMDPSASNSGSRIGSTPIVEDVVGPSTVGGAGTIEAEGELQPASADTTDNEGASTATQAQGEGEADMEVQLDNDGAASNDQGEDMIIEAGPSHIGKRVKVYELRDSSWFDRGTGHCKGVYDDTQDLALIIVEAEDLSEGKEAGEGEGGFLKEELLLSTRVEKDDIYARQQDTLIVWTEPQSNLDIALSFQDAEGCEDIWSFVCDVQRHLNNLPSDADHHSASSERFSLSPPPGAAATDHARTHWVPLTLANIKDQQVFLNMQSKSQVGREKIIDRIVHVQYVGPDWLQQLISVFEQAEDLESLEDIHAISGIVHLLLTMNDNGLLDLLLKDNVFIGILGVLEYDPEIPTHKASYRQFYQDTAKFRQVIEIKDPYIQTKIHQTYRLHFLKEVVLSRVLDEGTFGILNGFIYFSQVDIVNHIQNNDAFLVELLSVFKSPPTPLLSSRDQTALAIDDSPLDQRKRDTVMFIHQLLTLAKPIQALARIGLYRGLIDRGLLYVVKWAFRRPEAQILHTASETLTFTLEHDTNAVRNHILKENDAGHTTLLGEMIGIQASTTNIGLASHLSDSIRHLLDMPSETESVFARKEGPLADNFVTFFYETSALQLFKPITDLPQMDKENPPPRLPRHRISLLILLVELLSFCVSHHAHRASYFILSNPISKSVINLLQIKDKPLRHAVLRFARTCLRTPNHFIHRYFVKQDLIPPLLDLLEEESSRDNMLSSSCMDVLDLIRKENIKPIINHIFDNYRTRLEALGQRPYLRAFIQGLTTRWEQNNEPPPAPPQLDAETSAGSGSGWKNQAQEEDYFNASDEEDAPKPKRAKKPPMPRGPNANQAKSPAARSRTAASPTTPTPKASLGLDYDDGSDSDGSNGTQSPRQPAGTVVTEELEEDLGDVAMRMRAKRQREEEDDEGFAGLLGSIAKAGGGKKEVKSEGAQEDVKEEKLSTPTTPTTASTTTKVTAKKESFTPGKRLKLHLGFGKKK